MVGFGAGLAAGFAAGLVDFIEVDFIELDDFIDDFIDDLAGALLAMGLAVAAVFWSNGFLVAFAAGLADDFAAGLVAGFAAGLADIFIEPMELFDAAFGDALGLVDAAIAGAVIMNAAARSDARVFFIQ